MSYRKIIAVLSAPLLLSACIIQRDPGVGMADNQDIPKMSCDQIKQELSKTLDLVDNLQRQNRAAGLSNGLNVFSALLSLNPLLLQGMTDNSKISSTLASYQDRATKLSDQQKKQCAGNPLAVTASEPVSRAEPISKSASAPK